MKFENVSSPGRVPVVGLLVVLSVLGVVVIGGGGTVISADGDTIPLTEEVLGETDPLDGDTDDDGLFDGAEIDAGTDPLVSDTDGDGLADGAEIETDADPLVSDTDGDGLDDGAEVTEYATSPATSDSDSDGIGDAEEIAGPTDATASDTDSDGLLDGEETTAGTDPLVSDTDGDGLDDGSESEIGTNPLVSDSDDDGLGDGAEVTQFDTDPLVSDTDGDGLADGREVSMQTDVTVADTDGDQLADGREIAIGTDPLGQDTDGDGFQDGVEVKAATERPTLFGDGSPLRKDIYLEVDYMQGTGGLSGQEVSKLTRAFDNAPLQNPDGSRGISLHVFEGTRPVPSQPTTSFDDYLNNQHQSEFDTEGIGFRHALIVNDAVDEEGNPIGITSVQEDGMLIEAGTEHTQTGSILMHELGHSLGLSNQVFSGVDSREYSPTEYPSVMNYNRTVCDDTGCEQLNRYAYSNGRGHDDWAFIEEQFTTQAPNTNDLARSLAG